MRFHSHLRFLSVLLLSLALIQCRQEGSPQSSATLVASGFVESPVYQVATELGGLVTELLVHQGQQVRAGEPILQLSNSALESALAQAGAAVTAAESALSSLDERPGPVKLAAASAAVSSARAEIMAAEAQLDMLIVSYDSSDLEPPPLELHAAEGAVDLARARLALALAQQSQLKQFPNEAERDIAVANLSAAKSNHELISSQIQRLQLLAPVDGVIEQILVHKGELAQPGVALMLVGESSGLLAKVYIPVDRVAQLSPGQRATISVDAYPEQAFRGRIKRIARRAQFTPTSVQTQEQRVKMVFAVEITIDDPTGRLKPGMPADVRLDIAG